MVLWGGGAAGYKFAPFSFVLLRAFCCCFGKCLSGELCVSTPTFAADLCLEPNSHSRILSILLSARIIETSALYPLLSLGAFHRYRRLRKPCPLLRQSIGYVESIHYP